MPVNIGTERISPQQAQYLQMASRESSVGMIARVLYELRAGLPKVSRL